MKKHPWTTIIWRWHALAGIVIAPILIIVALSGALYVFKDDIQQALLPEATPTTQAPISPDTLLAKAQSRHPNARPVRYYPSHSPGDPVLINLMEDETRHAVYLDPYTGESAELPLAKTFAWILDLHRTLLLGEVGRYLIEAATSWAIITLFTGTFLWLRERRWRWRKTQNARLRLKDRHSITAMYGIPILAIIAITGLFFTQAWGQGWKAALYLTNSLPKAFVQKPQSTPDTNAPEVTLTQLMQIAQDQAPYPLYRIAFPKKDTDPYILQGNLTSKPWESYYLYINRYGGQTLDQFQWRDLNPATKLSLLAYPLHTGIIGGLATKILALSGAFLYLWLATSGLLMWRARAYNMKTLQQRQPLPNSLAWTAVTLGILFPLAGVSMLIYVLFGLRKKRSKQTQTESHVAVAC